MISDVLEQLRTQYTATLGLTIPIPPPAPFAPDPTVAGPRGFAYRCDACGDLQGFVPAGEPIACWCCGGADGMVAR